MVRRFIQDDRRARVILSKIAHRASKIHTNTVELLEVSNVDQFSIGAFAMMTIEMSTSSLSFRSSELSQSI
jgi:hypothetical protein